MFVALLISNKTEDRSRSCFGSYMIGYSIGLKYSHNVSDVIISKFKHIFSFVVILLDSLCKKKHKNMKSSPVREALPIKKSA